MLKPLQSAHAFTAGPRFAHPFWGQRMAVFGEASVGLAMAGSDFERSGEPTYRERFFGVASRVGAGLKPKKINAISPK